SAPENGTKASSTPSTVTTARDIISLLIGLATLAGADHMLTPACRQGWDVQGDCKKKAEWRQVLLEVLRTNFRNPRSSASIGTSEVPLSCFAQSPRQNCHSHRNTIAHLLHNHRLWAISHLPCQLQAANDRSGMHNNGVSIRQ